MLSIDFSLRIGTWSINSADDPRTECIALETNLAMNSPTDVCRIAVYGPPAPQPGLLEGAVGQVAGQAAGALGLGGEGAAFSVQVRGNEIKPDDAITVELAAGDRSGKVITAEVASVHSSLGQTEIAGATAMQTLAHTRLNQVYENQSLSQIMSDLAGQAGVDIGEVDTGGTYAYLVVHESRSVWAHLRELAMRDGLDLYCDTDNRLTLKAFNKTSADHTFFYGIDVLDLQLFRRQAACDQVRVYGESPSSNQGPDTWHWLVKDVTPFQSEVGDGGRLLAIQDSAVRTKDAADGLATAKFGAIQDGSAWGRLKILGNPAVQVADAVEIKDAPKPELNGLFKVTSVRHVLSKRAGYVTSVGFSGQGGAEAAGGLLGGAMGALGL
jgi:hypothetical protein